MLPQIIQHPAKSDCRWFSVVPLCRPNPTHSQQVDGCSTKLSNCKAYCVRYRVCQQHLSAVSVLLKGVESRFCQQCGRFHDLSEFDGAKRCAGWLVG